MDEIQLDGRLLRGRAAYEGDRMEYEELTGDAGLQALAMIVREQAEQIAELKAALRALREGDND